MKFVCKTEPYRHFRGVLFAYYRPTEVTDAATIKALEKHPDFRKVEDEKDTPTPPEKTKALADECPKCGRIVKRGKYQHQLHCRGK